MLVSSNGKVRRSEQEWREIFARFARSGLNRREFCRKEKINLNSLQRWSGRLGVPRQSEFIDVTPSREKSSSWAVEIELSDGTMVRVRS
jgi:transposase-like protein